MLASIVYEAYYITSYIYELLNTTYSVSRVNLRGAWLNQEAMHSAVSISVVEGACRLTDSCTRLYVKRVLKTFLPFFPLRE